ncbi:superoxide dismutase [Christiangramia flava]|uniref:Superoxide dismutase n=1 Tax=Christiangramia flava JLT2011 TaxID=1229726 RepID=A0A1L7I144_9FLAO|nr:superoxide dismutase [Christiangramia flava]APU67327.1 Manganese superoxide dismutase [Christiangramia flava JLT2011]OSS39912.1 Manganese superoxide dismutase [Christiangramia flava JLT2011]
MKFNLPELPYSYDALAPHIDAETMEIHHSKHHQGYTNKLNTALEDGDYDGIKLEDLFARVSSLSPAIRNNGGGFYNHSLFWTILSPEGGGKPSGALAEAIEASYGSFEAFKQEFEKAAATQFGSGWAWLIVDKENKVKVTATPNQDNPLMDVAEEKGTPILGLDVWEHAYYLNYQNKRPDYISAFWNIVNWTEVEKRFSAAKK